MENNFIVIYDGICNLCNWSVNFIINRDKNNKFKFAALQSNFVNTNFPFLKDINTTTSSVLLIKNKEVLKKSDAVFEIIKLLDSPVKYLSVLKIFPKAFIDFIYDFIANNRYKLFGKKDKCILPSDNVINKFIL